MKLIKLAAIVIVVILVLNSFGMLNDETSKKVDNVVKNVKTKINELEYKDKPLTDMSLKELSSNISSDINYLKEDMVTEDGLVLSGKGLIATINPTGDKVLVAEVDSSESQAIKSIEKLLFNLTKKKIQIPESMLEKGDFSVEVEKIDGEYNIRFN